ncbi:MAG: DUF6550 family protein [Oscillospiraceae bacterium]
MKNNTEKMKKWAVVAGGLVICAVLIALIGAQFQTPNISDPPLPSSSDTAPDVTPPEDELVFVPNTQDDATTSQPGESTGGNGDSSGTEQTIQPDVQKPEPPKEKPKVENEDALTNPEQPPEYKPEDTDKKPVPKPDQPQGGDVKDGKTYVPGFGWVDGTGDTHGSVVGNPDDELTGNKVGIM